MLFSNRHFTSKKVALKCGETEESWHGVNRGAKKYVFNGGSWCCDEGGVAKACL
jgi:hypothetical protein